MFALIFFLGPECADLHPARVLARGLSTFILQRFVLIRSLYSPPSFCPLPCLCCFRGSTISPRAVPLRTVMRLLPLLLPFHLPPSPLLFMPEPRRRRQRAAALLRPADIPGLAHLQPIQWLVLLLGRNDVCILCPLGGLWRPLIDQSSHFIFLFIFGFEDGAWCWLRPHQEALRCLISIGLLLFLNRKTEKPKR